MMDDQTKKSNPEQDAEEEDKPPPKFYILEEQGVKENRALPIMIANRMGYVSRQALDEEPTPQSAIKPYINQIADVDSKEADYLLPDTPLKEAIFRVILGNRNAPMTAGEISEILNEKWAMTAYPRDLTPSVIQRLIENSGSYCIVKLPDEDD